MANCTWMWTIFWLFALLLIGIPVGFLCAILWIIMSPFTACISGCGDCVSVLQTGLNIPQSWAHNMVGQKSAC
uniref:Uncharacterized protein n=1 Tax=Ciona savignyi TaxID=51511 RepID=H2YJN1_CIOSA